MEDRGTVSTIDDGGSPRVSHHRHPVDSGHPVDPGDEGASSSQGDTPSHRILHVHHPVVLSYLHGRRRGLGLSDKNRVRYELNLTGLQVHLGHDQGTRELVVRGLLRAIRFMQKVEVVYPPWEAWTSTPTLLGNHRDPDYLRVDDHVLDTGERRVVLRRRPRGRRRPDRGKLPNADVVVLKVTCIDLANRYYLAKVRDKKSRRTWLSLHHVPGPEWLGPHVVNAEVVAANPGRSIAFRSSASLQDGLLEGVEPTNTGLSEVVRSLRRSRRWAEAAGWFLGEIPTGS